MHTVYIMYIKFENLQVLTDLQWFIVYCILLSMCDNIRCVIG